MERWYNTYDRTAKPMCPRATNDIARVRSGSEWGPVTKVLKETAPRSYGVDLEQGNVLRRNRRQVLSTSPNVGTVSRSSKTAVKMADIVERARALGCSI